MNSINSIKLLGEKTEGRTSRDTQTIKLIAIQAIYLLLGFISTKSTVFNEYIPFTAALTACVPMKNTISCAVGILIGCFFPFTVNESFRYIATAITVVAIRWILNDLKILKSKSIFNIVLAVVPLLTTGCAMAFSSVVENKEIIVVYFAEALLSGTAAYFFENTMRIIYRKRELCGISGYETVCLAFTLFIGLLSLVNVNIVFISLGRVCAIIAILLCSYFGSVGGGSISGTVAGVILGLQGMGTSYIVGAYAFGGLVAGVFSQFGKISTAVAFLASNLIIAFQTADIRSISAYIVEVCIATVIFIVMPKKYMRGLDVLFDSGDNVGAFNALKDNLIMRLDFSARAIASVPNTVDSVAQKMRKITLSESTNIYKSIADKACGKCKLRSICWDKDYRRTAQAISGVIKQLQIDQPVSSNMLSRQLDKNCQRSKRILKQIKEEYSSYNKRLQASSYTDRIREVLDNQLHTMGKMLNDIVEEIDSFEDFIPEKSNKLTHILTDNNISVVKAVCRCDEDGHIMAEMLICGESGEFFAEESFHEKAQKALNCRIEKPMVSFAGGYGKIQICEKTPLKADFNCKQHICENKELCGDSFKSFNDGMGHLIFILSDGMGSGGRAAVDSAMASGITEKLLKSGLSYDCTLNIVNSALLVKSGEETFATLDLMIINLFNGEAQIVKAGAAQTYIKQGTVVQKVESPGLPLGILNEVSYAKTEIELDNCDKVLMISDGVSAYGEKWIEKKLLMWEEEDEEKIAQEILEEAVLRRNGARDDDITVVAIALRENKGEKKKKEEEEKSPRLLVKA